MRGLKIAVGILSIWCLGLSLFALTLRKSAKHNQDSLEAVLNLLEVRTWEVPMSKDTTLEWSFELRDYKEVIAVAKGKDDWMDSSKKAKIVFMPTGEESVHRFWLVQTNGTSSGRTRIDVCDNPERLQNVCDAGQFEYTWYPVAERIEDGKTYIICELNETFAPHRRKQLILHLIHFRLEDIQKELEKSPNNLPLEPKPVGPKSVVPKSGTKS